jgi:hypothetical protein
MLRWIESSKLLLRAARNIIHQNLNDLFKRLPNHLSELWNLQLIRNSIFRGPCLKWLTKLSSWRELTNYFLELPGWWPLSFMFQRLKIRYRCKVKSYSLQIPRFCRRSVSAKDESLSWKQGPQLRLVCRELDADKCMAWQVARNHKMFINRFCKFVVLVRF